MAEGDAPFGEVVGGKLKSDFVAGENADAIAAEAAGEVSEHKAILLQLHAEFTTGELFNHCSLNFDAVFFTHSDVFKSIVAEPAARSVRPLWQGRFRSG